LNCSLEIWVQFVFINIFINLGIIGHTYNPSTWETEAGGSPAPGQLRLHSENLSLKTKIKKNVFIHHKIRPNNNNYLGIFSGSMSS
jgi:hypothetical protein